MSTSLAVPRARLHAATLVVVALIAALVGFAAPSGATTAVAAPHASVVVPTAGRTTLALDPDTAQVLADNGVSVTPASEARAGKAGIAFPITGGLLDGASLGGKIKHSGGLTFKAGGKSLTIRNFVVNTRTKKLTAYADQARTKLPVLRLALGKAKINATSAKVVVSMLPVRLAPTAAGALNDYFSTDLFAGGLKIGTVRVSAKVVTLRS